MRQRYQVTREGDSPPEDHPLGEVTDPGIALPSRQEPERRIEMRPDSRQSLDQHDAEQPTAPRDTQQASSCALSPKREGALSMLRVPELVEQCRQEMQAYRRGEYSHDEYGLELLHRAIMQGQQEAWAGLERCLGELVRGWLYTHPYRELVLRWESEESYVALAFERFWHAT